MRPFSPWLFPLLRGVAAVTLVALTAASAPAADEVKHSFLLLGPDFTGIIGEDGKVEWDAGAKGSRDGFVLPGGNVLVAWMGEVKELTRDKQVVFRYQKSADCRELGTVQRLENGATLITELGPKPRLLEVSSAGEVKVEVPLLPETDNAHLQTRMARKLPNGNYLAPHLLAYEVKEYTPEGKVVGVIATDTAELGGRKVQSWPFTAIRLPNGNTLVGLTLSNRVAEFDPQGKPVWLVTNDDLEGKPMNDSCGVQRLPNGNTVIACHHANDGVRVFEITPEKKIVWANRGPYRVHHFQILTTNGKPIEGTPLK
jgi:hypothetical protein